MKNKSQKRFLTNITSASRHCAGNPSVAGIK